MKIIPKVLFALVFAFSPFTMRSQKFTVSPEIGYERTTYHIADSKNNGIGTHIGNGLRLGASAYYTVSNYVFFQSGLYYSHRGGVHMYGVERTGRFPFVKDVKLTTMDFLTLPLTVGYEIGMYSKLRIGISAGGYISSGIGMGNAYFRCTDGEGSAGSIFRDSEFTVSTADGSDRTRITVAGSDRIDSGLMFGAHLRFKNIRLRASYQLGLRKTIFDLGMPRTAAISLAYDFNL